MENVIKLLEVLKSYVKDWKGLVITAGCGVLLYLVFLFGTKYIEQKFSELSQEVTARTEQLITDNKDDYQQKVFEGIQVYPEIDMRINDILDNVNSFYDFNRSVIYSFHDGTKTPTGKLFIKYSMKYERIRKERIKIEAQTPYNQNIGIDAIAYFMVNIKDNTTYYAKDVNNIGDGMILYQYKNLGVKSIVCNPLYDREDNLIGMLVNYSYDSYKTFDEEELKNLKTESVKVASLIDLMYYGN